jgi:hypothetical protein
MQKGKDLKDLGTDVGQRREPTGPRWAQAGALSPPFELAAIRAIYSPDAKSHTSIHSSSAAEEQRRKGHHLGEERVEQVD